MDIEIEWGDDGLVPAVAQSVDGEVLMMAYVDREALHQTLETGYAHYHSRSRDELWKKGGSSGNLQEVVDVRVDCDADSLLYVVKQHGGACHKGYRSCFYRNTDGEITGEKIFDPNEVYD